MIYQNVITGMVELHNCNVGMIVMLIAISMFIK